MYVCVVALQPRSAGAREGPEAARGGPGGHVHIAAARGVRAAGRAGVPRDPAAAAVRASGPPDDAVGADARRQLRVDAGAAAHAELEACRSPAPAHRRARHRPGRARARLRLQRALHAARRLHHRRTHQALRGSHADLKTILLYSSHATNHWYFAFVFFPLINTVPEIVNVNREISK